MGAAHGDEIVVGEQVAATRSRKIERTPKRARNLDSGRSSAIRSATHARLLAEHVRQGKDVALAPLDGAAVQQPPFQRVGPRQPLRRHGAAGGVCRRGLLPSGISTASLSCTSTAVVWRAGDRDAFDQIVPFVHDEPRRLASFHLLAEKATITVAAVNH
jgi:hypothetical protein